MGAAATTDQWQDAEEALDRDSDTPYHFLTRSRGGSKTTDLAAIAIVVMVEQAPPGARLYVLAADQAQGRLLLDSMRGFAERTPGLQGAFVFTESRATTRTGVVLEILAADASGTWGLRPFFLICDEIAQWLETRRVREIFDAATTAVRRSTDDWFY